MSNYSYFFKIIEYNEKVLPKDIRKMGYESKINNLIIYNEIKNIIDDVFLMKVADKSLKMKIQYDVKNIFNAVSLNEKQNNILLLDVSRFSFVFKIGNKVIKVGFPKIIYSIPKLDMIANSIIRKQYTDNNGVPVLFVEVQQWQENNLSLVYGKDEIEEILYKLWKSLREIGIVWYDPKEKNLVLNSSTENTDIWNNEYYNQSSQEEKGIYKLKEKFLNKNILPEVLIIDTDLFLPVTVLETLMKMAINQPELPGFNNWKFKRVIEYEKRYLKEYNDEK